MVGMTRIARLAGAGLALPAGIAGSVAGAAMASSVAHFVDHYPLQLLVGGTVGMVFYCLLAAPLFGTLLPPSIRESRLVRAVLAAVARPGKWLPKRFARSEGRHDH